MQKNKFDEVHSLLQKMLDDAYRRGREDALKETSKGHGSTELLNGKTVKYNIVERKKEEE